MGSKYQGSDSPEIRELARVSSEEMYPEESAELIAEILRRVDSETDLIVGPPAGSWAATARLMAGPNPTDEEGEFWDRWKDEMKMKELGK